VRVVVREGGRIVAQKGFPRMLRGASRVMTWRAQPGTHAYTIEVSGRGPEGAGRTSVDVTVVVMRPLEIAVRRETIDLETRTIRFAINNPGSRARLIVSAANGAVLHDAETDISAEAPGRPIEVRWPELRETIARMVLRVSDASDSWGEYEIVPWAVEIPHEDVVFASGSSEIPPAEAPKLDVAHQRILEAIREHGRDLAARLYVLGHTDTVGSPSDNQTLSQRRAIAIARYFRQRGGITLPIVARGFGESAPAVRTPDNTDEARNRRAQYILAAQPPAPGGWTPVP
jgi:outer membrane protein OmpA-like peptidoglycan-associated protein